MLRKDTFIYILLDIYRFITVSLLLVFIPQKCGNDICTYKENMFRESHFEQFVLAFNFLTLLIYLISLYAEWLREKFCDDYLCIDPSYPDDYLKTNVFNFPDTESTLINISKHYYYLTLVLLFTNMLNITLSSIVFSYCFFGFQTITMIITYLILIVERIYLMISISSVSQKSFSIYSSYLSSQSIYNKKKDQTLKFETIYPPSNVEAF